MKAGHDVKELRQYGGLQLLTAYIMIELDCSEDEAADIAYNVYPSVDLIIKGAR